MGYRVYRHAAFAPGALSRNPLSFTRRIAYPVYTPKNISRARGSLRTQRTRDRNAPEPAENSALEAERPGSGETEQYHGYRCNRSSHQYHALTIRPRRTRAPNAAHGPNITSNRITPATRPSPSGRPPACVLAEVARDARARGTRARSGSGTSRCSMLTWIEWKSTGALQTRTATRTSPRPSSRPRDTSTSAGGQSAARKRTRTCQTRPRQLQTGPASTWTSATGRRAVSSAVLGRTFCTQTAEDLSAIR